MSELITIPKIIKELKFSEDKGDVEAISSELLILYNDIEDELFHICNERENERLDQFKKMYFLKQCK